MKKVLCWGTFDRLHRGHLEFLKGAKSKGGYLIVVVVPDKAVFKNKNKFPKNTQEKRVNKLKDLPFVDKVILATEDLRSNFELIFSLKPEIFVSGYDQKTLIERMLKDYFKKKKVKLDCYTLKEFAGGIHTSNFIK